MRISSIFAEVKALTFEMLACHARRDLPAYYRINRLIHQCINRAARNALLTLEIASEEKVEHDIEDLMKVETMDRDTAKLLASKGIGTQEALAHPRRPVGL